MILCPRCGGRMFIEEDIRPRTRYACCFACGHQQERTLSLAQIEAESPARSYVVPNRPHGTLSAYQSYGCRCDPCKAAHAAYYHAYRIRRRARELAATRGE